ncbi:ribonuclease H-like domain-containing protein [Circinella umbellata]|nr:ribonuclease H-like domain-containing protein [Circinella umbellata]
MVAYNEVSTESFAGLYNAILDKVSNAQYVAIDCEFTGHLRDLISNMEQRYDAMAQVVRSHSILSVGLTTITADRAFDNFEFLLNNQTPYQSNAANLKFLAQSGFDFNRHYSIGLPFRPGPFSATTQQQQKSSSSTAKNKKMGQKNYQQQQKQLQDTQERQLRELWFDIFNILRTKNIPLIVHNGLLDLMYIYQSFITSLPAKLSGFVADMVEAFPGGIYDTKYISNYVSYEQITFLAYLYHKYKRTGYKVDVQKALTPAYIDDNHDENNTQPKKRRRKNSHDNDDKSLEICHSFATRGYCPAGQACKRSHDLDRILDRDQNVNTKDPSSVPSVPSSPEQEQQQVKSMQQQKEHSAHYDSYMTGYIFCYMVTQYQAGDELHDAMNKLNIMKLDIPLRITHGNFSKPTLQWQTVKKYLHDRHISRTK